MSTPAMDSPVKPKGPIRRNVPALARGLFATALCLGSAAAAADEVTCGSLVNAYGPFDYRTAEQAKLKLVEDYHFSRDVEAGRAGKTGKVGDDLDYVLRAFPNHQRALVALVNVESREKTEKVPGLSWPVSCYFDRALRFAPDDREVVTIYGVYLLRHKQTTEAIAQFERAAELGEDSGNLHYNAGLAYFDAGDYDKALLHAHKAYALGFSLPGLRDKLKKKGKWVD